MSIKFLGCGSAFTTLEYCQSNALLTDEKGRGLLIDCGTDIRHALASAGIPMDAPCAAIEGVYVSHCHSDHVGGLEYLAFTSYFGGRRKLKLLAEENTAKRIWESTLKGGMELTRGGRMELADYFEVVPLLPGANYRWGDATLEMMPMMHIAGGEQNGWSFGLHIAERGGSVFLTTDTIFSPEIIAEAAQRADAIFHDCETSPVKTGVHAHYDELLTLPAEIRLKIWLYHYQPDPTQNPARDGFRGFVSKGDVFNHFGEKS